MSLGSEAMAGVGRPHCEYLLVADDRVLSEACNEWSRNRAAPVLTGPVRGTTIPMNQWDPDRGAVVGTLAITMEFFDQHDR